METGILHGMLRQAVVVQKLLLLQMSASTVLVIQTKPDSSIGMQIQTDIGTSPAVLHF